MKNLEILKKLVSIKSFDSCNEIVDFLKDYLKGKVKEIKIIDNKFGKKSVLIGINTMLKNIQPIVLSGHIDTVVNDEKMLNLSIKDGKAYGLGVIDMKCFMASIIDKLDELKKIKCPIVVALSTDEETTFTSIKDIICEFKKLNIKPKFTIVGEPTKFQIMTTANGCYEYELEIFGKSCHSSLAYYGINAINVAAKLITFIESEQKAYKNLTSNVGIISGGDIVNRVPEYAKICFDVRTADLNKFQKFMNLINAKIGMLEKEYGAKIQIEQKYDILPLQCIDYKNIENLAKYFCLGIGKFSGGCEAGYFENIGSPTILFGVGDLAVAHKQNEFLVISDHYKYNNLLVKMIEKICDVYY